MFQVLIEMRRRATRVVRLVWQILGGDLYHLLDSNNHEMLLTVAVVASLLHSSDKTV